MEQSEQQPNQDHAGRTWSIFCHLSALSVYIGVPLGNILVPLIIWLIKKDELPQVDEHGKQSLNFQISLTIYAILAAIAFAAVMMSAFIIGGEYAPRVVVLFIPLIFIFFILAHLALTIIAAIKAGEGTIYRYPLAIRFLR
jgi:uncharacterized protein